MIPLRIFMLLDRYIPVIGGAELQAHQLSQTLIKRGHKVQVVTRLLYPELPRTETIEGIPVHRLSPVGLSHIANALVVGRFFSFLLRNSDHYDIIHVHGVGPVGMAAILAGKLVHRPVVIKAAAYGNLSRHDHAGIKPSLYSRLLRRFLLPAWMWKWILHQATAFVAISKEISDEAFHLGLTQRVFLIPNGVNTHRFSPANAEEKRLIREQLGFEQNQTVLLFSGRLVAGKRIDVVLTALAQVLRTSPDCMLLLAGSGSLQQDNVEHLLLKQVNDLGIDQHVRFLGSVKEIERYYKMSDVFVFSSEREGMPNVILEAMASGLPIVATNIEGVTQLVDHNQAWLTPVGDHDALAGALAEVLKNPVEAARKARIANEAAKAEFSIDAVANRYEQMYKKILGQTTINDERANN